MANEQQDTKGSRRIPVSLRASPSYRTVRVSLLKPILNMARFFVGDTIPRVNDAKHVGERIKELKRRGIPLKDADNGMLNKVIVLLLRAEKQDDTELFESCRLLGGLLLYVIEDDYFFIPEVVEHASLKKLEKLARKLGEAHKVRNDMLASTIRAYKLSILSAADLEVLKGQLPAEVQTPEVASALNKLRSHLSQGESIFGGHKDADRREKHRQRLQTAYKRATNLIARLLAIPENVDHGRLRSRILEREHRVIELDSLGAEVISEHEQSAQSKQLLAKTEKDRGETASRENHAEIAARLQAMKAEAKQEAAAQPAEEEEDAGWFFDME